MSLETKWLDNRKQISTTLVTLYAALMVAAVWFKLETDFFLISSIIDVIVSWHPLSAPFCWIILLAVMLKFGRTLGFGLRDYFWGIYYDVVRIWGAKLTPIRWLIHLSIPACVLGFLGEQIAWLKLVGLFGFVCVLFLVLRKNYKPIFIATLVLIVGWIVYGIVFARDLGSHQLIAGRYVSIVQEAVLFVMLLDVVMAIARRYEHREERKEELRFANGDISLEELNQNVKQVREYAPVYRAEQARIYKEKAEEAKRLYEVEKMEKRKADEKSEQDLLIKEALQRQIDPDFR